METKELVTFLEGKANKGEIKKVNERRSFNIGVTDNKRNFTCTVITDLYKDKEGNDLCRIEHRIDNESGYHAIDVDKLYN
ncbi:MAG: hypothetical protein ABFR05_00100 [Bacteroidota bacterium]